MNYYVTKYFFYATMKLEFAAKTIIEKVNMYTVKITIIAIYKVIKTTFNSRVLKGYNFIKTLLLTLINKRM